MTGLLLVHLLAFEKTVADSREAVPFGRSDNGKKRSERVKTFQQQELKVGLLEIEINGDKKNVLKKVSSDQFRVTVRQTVAAPSQIIIPSTIQVSGWVLHNCSPDLQGLIYVSAFWHFK